MTDKTTPPPPVVPDHDLPPIMVFLRAGGWYPALGIRDKCLRQQAAEHAELNPGTLRVEDEHGNILWVLQ